jgi:flagellar export protein FliJ
VKKFSFRLERVLQLRILAEQAQARRLADARQYEAEQRLYSEAGAARVAEAISQLAATPSDLRTAGTLSNLVLTVEAARARAAAASAAHRESLARLESEITSFEESRQARRAIERLREQRLAAWQQQVDRMEQGVMDEVASRRAHGHGAAG